MIQKRIKPISSWRAYRNQDESESLRPFEFRFLGGREGYGIFDSDLGLGSTCYYLVNGQVGYWARVGLCNCATNWAKRERLGWAALC